MLGNNELPWSLSKISNLPIIFPKIAELRKRTDDTLREISISFTTRKASEMEIYGMTGERLGVIGTEDSKSEKRLPQWKQDFLSKPSVSVRRGIAWGYEKPYEDADVLALTAPSSKFVDIRLPLIDEVGKNPVLSEHSAFWAFTGTATTTFIENTAGMTMLYSAHCVWKHDVDSNGPGGGDEGDMFLLPNGDCMEVGSMENPETGRNEMYKEYWTEPPAPTDADYITKLPCVVAETIPSQQCPRRGRMIRVGDYIQAVIETGAGDDAHNETDKADIVIPDRWIRTYQDGHHRWIKDDRCKVSIMPTSWICEDSLEVGNEIEQHGVKWKITELVR